MEMPTFDALLNPALKALHELGSSASNSEHLERVISDLNLPQDVVDRLHPRGGSLTVLEYRLAWARSYLKKYGLIDNSSRGVWALTPKGRDTTKVDPQEVTRAVRGLYAQEKLRQEPEIESSESDISVDDDEAGWQRLLLKTLQEMPPASFERLCQRILRESGFVQVEVTGRSGDGGIDGHGVLRLAGLLSFQIIFQSKRYAGNIGSSTIRDFRGAMVGRADKGLIITTGGFSRDAKTEATRDGAPPIDLIDGEALAGKLKELGLGVKTTMVESIEVDPAWFSSF